MMEYPFLFSSWSLHKDQFYFKGEGNVIPSFDPCIVHLKVMIFTVSKCVLFDYHYHFHFQGVEVKITTTCSYLKIQFLGPQFTLRHVFYHWHKGYGSLTLLERLISKSFPRCPSWTRSLDPLSFLVLRSRDLVCFELIRREQRNSIPFFFSASFVVNKQILELTTKQVGGPSFASGSHFWTCIFPSQSLDFKRQLLLWIGTPTCLFVLLKPLPLDASLGKFVVGFQRLPYYFNEWSLVLINSPFMYSLDAPGHLPFV